MDWTSCCLCLRARSWIVFAEQRAAERWQTEALINAVQPGKFEGDKDIQRPGMSAAWDREEKEKLVL